MGGRFLARQKTTTRHTRSFLSPEPGRCTEYFDIVLHSLAKMQVDNPWLHIPADRMVAGEGKEQDGEDPKEGRGEQGN